MVDYSKWDNIELSDDSDVEVHPNVDKNSFIRWKQRDIHEKRLQRAQQIKGLRIQKEMYTQLTKRALYLLTEFKGDLSNDTERNDSVNGLFDKNEICKLEQNPDTPPYNEMLEDLFIQMKDDMKKDDEQLTSSNIKLRLKAHQEKINKVMLEIDPKIVELENEDHEKITSDDYKEGFNSSFINKKADENTVNENTVPVTVPAASNAKPISTSEKKIVEVINNSKPVSNENFLDEMTVAPTTTEFSKLTTFESSKNFILKNPNFVTHQQKDALLMSCFDLVLAGELKLASQIIKQAIIIQWVSPMINGDPSNPEEAMFSQMPLKAKLEYVAKFFSQLSNDSSPLRQRFDLDVDQMVQHIKKRCEVIKTEEVEGESNEGVEQIQLKSLDPNTELKVNIPDENSKEFEVFKTLPQDMQDAIKIGSLDAVNEVFARMEIKEAEDVLEKFNESGVISIQALLENEKEFEQLQEQLQEQEGDEEYEHVQQPSEVIEHHTNTVDIVD